MLCRLCHSLRVTFVPFISFCSDHACVWLELCSRQSAILSFSIFNFSAFRRSLFFWFFFIEFHNFCKLPTQIDNLPLDAFSIHPSAFTLVLFVLYFCSHFYSLFNFFLLFFIFFWIRWVHIGLLVVISFWVQTKRPMSIFFSNSE